MLSGRTLAPAAATVQKWQSTLKIDGYGLALLCSSRGFFGALERIVAHGLERFAFTRSVVSATAEAARSVGKYSNQLGADAFRADSARAATSGPALCHHPASSPQR
jgi:hypothetical protein